MLASTSAYGAYDRNHDKPDMLDKVTNLAQKTTLAVTSTVATASAIGSACPPLAAAATSVYTTVAVGTPVTTTVISTLNGAFYTTIYNPAVPSLIASNPITAAAAVGVVTIVAGYKVYKHLTTD